MSLPRLLLLALTTISCTGDIQRKQLPIANGSTDFTFDSVGKVGEHCTGTLIGRRTVLTAAHCIEIMSIEELYFTQEGQRYSALSAHMHPSYNPDPQDISEIGGDIGIIRLQQKIPFVVPEQLATSAPQEDWLVELLGYGRTSSEGGWGTRRRGVSIIHEVLPSIFEMRADVSDGDSITCAGDSGGPAFHAGQVIGVHSRSSCDNEYWVDWWNPFDFEAVAFDVRVDQHLSWLQDIAEGDIYNGEYIPEFAPTVQILDLDEWETLLEAREIRIDAKGDVLREVEIWVDGMQVDTLYDAPYEFTLWGASGEHLLEVVAVDSDDNKSTDYRSYVIHNPVVPDSPEGFPEESQMEGTQGGCMAAGKQPGPEGLWFLLVAGLLLRRRAKSSTSEA